MRIFYISIYFKRFSNPYYSNMYALIYIANRRCYGMSSGDDDLRTQARRISAMS